MPIFSAGTSSPIIQARIRPVTSVAMAPQRNQNSASGRMNLVIAGRISIGIFGTVGAWVKLKYQRWPIHITPDATCSQRKEKALHSKLTSSIFAPPFRADRVNQEHAHDREGEAQRDRLP